MSQLTKKENPTVSVTAFKPVADAKPLPVRLRINGKNYQLELEPWTSILDALREHLDLAGTKKGCDHG